MRVVTFLVSLVALTSDRPSAQQVQTGFLDRSVTIAGNLCRYQIYVPSNYSTAQQWPVILFLHGAGERGSDGLLQTNAGLGPAIRRTATFTTLAHRLGRLPTWIFHGELDPLVPVAQSRQAAEALRLVGGDVRYTEFPGMEHNVWDAVYASPQFLEWLFAQRRRR